MRGAQGGPVAFVLHRTNEPPISGCGGASANDLRSKEARDAHGIFQLLAQNLNSGLLAGPGQDFLRNLGTIGRALLFFRPDVAALCPNLVHEAQMGLERWP